MALLCMLPAPAGAANAAMNVRAQFIVARPVEDGELIKRIADVERARSGPASGLADALYRAAARSVELHDFPEAEKFLRQSLEVEETLRRPDKRIDTMTQIGTMLMFQHKIEEALQQYRLAQKFAESAQLKDARAVLSNDIATCYRMLGHTKEAQSELEAALATTSDDLINSKTILLRSLSGIYHQEGENTKAINCAQKAVDLQAKGGDQALEGKARCFLARLQDAAGNYDAALKEYQSVLTFDRSLFPDVLCEAELGMGDLCFSRQQIPAAAVHYEHARDLAKEDEHSPDVLLKALTGLGMCYADSERFKEAEQCHQQVLELSAAANPTDRWVDASLQLCEDYLLQGAAEKALKVLDEASKKVTSTTDPVAYRANIAGGYSKCYKQLGQRDRAISEARDAIRLFHDAGDPISEALMTNTLATIFLDFNMIDDADGLEKEASAVYQNLSSAPARARFDYNRAQARLMRGHDEEAISIFQKALDGLGTTGDTGLQSALLRGLGLAYLLSGNNEKALSAYQQALALSKDSGSIDTQWSCNLGVGKALKRLGRLAEAEPYLQKAVDLVEQERSMLTRDAFKTHNLDFRRDCFYELVELYAAENKPYEALAVAERGKARAFLDMLANRGGKRIIGNAGSPKLVATSSQAGTRSVTVRSTRTAEDSGEPMVVSPVNAQPPTIDEMKQLVQRRGATIIEYLCVRDKIYCWVIDSNGTIHMPPAIANSAAPDSLVRNLTDNIVASAASRAEIVQQNMARQLVLRRLYDALLKPVEQWLPQKPEGEVTIIPDGYLFSVPFAALIDDHLNFAVEKHTISYAPALGVLRATQKLSEEVVEKPHKLLAFGNPITKEQQGILAPLPYTEKEVTKIAALYGPERSTVRIGAEANKAAFEELLPQATDIHLATHGLVDEAYPMLSALVLAPKGEDDGWLTVRDILGLNNLKAKLVVLSACETGKGRITGDGVVGLSRAFIIAGTPSVLVSQWNVDDAMTEYQMSRFYKSYLEGLNKAQSLRQAQLATIRFMENAGDSQAHVDPGKPRANPRYWAAFQLIGENK